MEDDIMTFVDMSDKYSRRALLEINGMNHRTWSVKRTYVDKRHKGWRHKNPLKEKYVRSFKKARARIEFNDHFDCSTSIKANKRKEITYKHDVAKSKQFFTSRQIMDLGRRRMDGYTSAPSWTFQWVMWSISPPFHKQEHPFPLARPVSTHGHELYEDACQEFKTTIKNWANEYMDGRIVRYELIKRYTPPALVGQAGKSFQQAEKTWLRKSPNTKTLCGIASYLICKNAPKKLQQYLEDVKNGYDRTILATDTAEQHKRLKKKYPQINDHYADETTLRLLAEHGKRDIWVYDNLFNIKWKFEGSPKSRNTAKKPPIELYLARGHFQALLRWKDIEAYGYTKEEQEEKAKQKQEEKENTDKIITTKVFPKEQRTTKLASWDLEASPDDTGSFRTWALGFAWFDKPNTIKYKKWFKMTCISEWLDFLYDNRETFNGFYLYAHNGGKFDFSLIMKEALLTHPKWRINTSNKMAIEQNASWISVVMETKVDGKRYSITFRDSSKLFPETLAKVTKDFKVKHQKLPETVNHKEIAHFMRANDFDVDALLLKFPQIRKYLKHDCLGLLEVVNSFSKVVWEVSFKKGYKKIKRRGKVEYKPYSGGLDLVQLLTGATLAKKTFFLKYYKQYEFPLYSLSPKKDKFIRDSYLGGRTEVLYKQGKVDGNRFYYLDFTSLYPFCASANELPYGEPQEKNASNWNLHGSNTSEWTPDQHKEFEAFYGFVQVKVRTKNDSIVPLHGVKHNKKLLFPVMDNWIDTTLFSEEIKKGLSLNQYEYIIGDGIGFEKAFILRDYMIDGFKRKAEAKEKGLNCLAQIWKIIINSGYGWLGLRTKDRDGVEIFERGSPLSLLDVKNLISEADIGNYTIQRKKKDLPIEDFNVAVASAITSYARMRLFDLIHAIHTEGGRVFYCDTDSIICDVDILNTPHLQKEFMPDKTGDALGSLKNECNEQLEKAMKKAKGKRREALTADYEHHMKHEKGSLYYDKLITYQAKFYSVQKTLHSGEVLDISKCKGYKPDELNSNTNLSYEMFEADDTLIQVPQDQFLVPKSGMVNESNSWGVQLKGITKTYNRNYKKGIVDQHKKIAPIRI